MNEHLTIRGRSLGGIYTSIFVPELGVMFDAGVALRENVSARVICLSHGHADHVGALPAFLGMRGLFGHQKPITVYCPVNLVDPLENGLSAFQNMQTHPLKVQIEGMSAGDIVSLTPKLKMKAFRTYHPVPSLGYSVFEEIKKLKSEFFGLAGPDIRNLKQEGRDIFDTVQRHYFAYATDTLPEVFKHEPWLLSVPELMVECTFLDDRKTLSDARRGGHIHLEELAPILENSRAKKIHLMHFSQLYQPSEVRVLLEQNLKPETFARVCPVLPATPHWWH